MKQPLTNDERIMLAIYTHLEEHQENIVALSGATFALITTLKKLIPGFSEAYQAELDSKETAEDTQSIRARLTAMTKSLETLRQILGVQPEPL